MVNILYRYNNGVYGLALPWQTFQYPSQRLQEWRVQDSGRTVQMLGWQALEHGPGVRGYSHYEKNKKNDQTLIGEIV